MPAGHLALEVVADVRQRLAGDGENLCVANLHEVHMGGDRLLVRLGQAQRGGFHDGQQHRRVDRQRYVPTGATDRGIRLRGGTADNSQRLIGEQVPDALALFPSLHILPVRPAHIGGDHAAQCTVHENAGATAVRRQAVVQRPDHVRAEDALTRAEHFGVDGIVDQRGERLAVAPDRLHHATARVVQLRRIIVVGDLPGGLAGGDPQRHRLQPSNRLVDRLGGRVADEIEIV